MKKLFYLLMLTVVTPLMFMQCSSDDKDDSNKKEPDPIEEGDFDPDDFVTFREVASFDTTFTFKDPAKMWSCTANWASVWDTEESYLIKITKRAQQDLLDKAKDKFGTDKALYITDVHCWPAASGQIAAVVLKGNQNNFEQVTKGQFTNYLIGEKWLRLILPLEEKAIRINAAEDFFVGIHAKNVTAKSFIGTYVIDDNRFPGLDATYPSFAYCPNSELYLQELNDPNEERWDTHGMANFCIKVRICTLKEFN